MKNLFLKCFGFLCLIGGLNAQPFQPEENVKQKFVTENEKFFIGLELRTSNLEMPSQVKGHWERFYKEFFHQIPNRVHGSILALYTDYEGDYTKPFSYIIGCEVSSVDEIPEGMVGRVIPKAHYALFPSDGPFPTALVETWQKVWKADIHRTYTSDFEFYGSDFDPIKNPKVDIYIAVEEPIQIKAFGEF